MTLGGGGGQCCMSCPAGSVGTASVDLLIVLRKWQVVVYIFMSKGGSANPISPCSILNEGGCVHWQV